jgi:hypothetical protein
VVEVYQKESKGRGSIKLERKGKRS